jgi:hypothetical protein
MAVRRMNEKVVEAAPEVVLLVPHWSPEHPAFWQLSLTHAAADHRKM